jgi:amidohydrolase family protein
MTMLTRRSAMMGLAGSALGACHNPLDPIDPADAKLTDPATPFTCDVHSHVFNGADVQITRFFDDVIALEQPELRAFGPLLGALGDFAPSVADENKALDRIAPDASSRNNGMVQGAARALREDRYQYAKWKLQEAYWNVYGKAAPAYRPRGVTTAAADARYKYAGDRLRYNIELLDKSKDFATFRDTRRAEQLKVTAAPPPEAVAAGRPALGLAVDGAFDFVMRNFQFRYVNVHDYLVEYSAGPRRKIDLMVTTEIDYDWPLGSQQGTRSSLTDQVALSERISRLTRGWVHTHVPFCPFKQVAFDRGLTRDDPMALVKDAVLNRGHLGVKFYPPMGFRPLGNEPLPDSFWNDCPVVGELRRGGLGADLDKALRRLYDFAGDNDVPLMAHTSPTNITATKFRTEIMHPAFWANVIAYRPGLRINFAHFGDTDILASGDANAKSLMNLMTTAPGSAGEHLYADSAFLSEILSNPSGMQGEFAGLLGRTPPPGCAALAERLMYGTDWEMVVIEGRSTTAYLSDFQALFDVLAASPTLNPHGDLNDRFFGRNSADYLGLRAGQATRRRLDAFHRGKPQPAWMAKVDRLPVA